MSDGKMTPGQWIIHPDDHAIWLAVVNESGNVIASVCTKADAQAIAALPYLIEALQYYATGKPDDGAWAKAVLKKAGAQ